MFLVAIQVEALDRSRLLSDVTRVLSDQHVNILSASVTTSRDRVAISRFTFEMGDPTHLGAVLKAVKGVEGVFDVYRVTSSAAEARLDRRGYANVAVPNPMAAAEREHGRGELQEREHGASGGRGGRDAGTARCRSGGADRSGCRPCRWASRGTWRDCRPGGSRPAAS